MPKNLTPSPNALLASERMGSDVHDWIAERRRDGESWHRISVGLYEQTGILLTGAAIRRWFSTDPATERAAS